MLKDRAVGIMGGTFDPIHFGHLVIAEGARVQFNLDEILFVPSGSPPHKERESISPAAQRYRMTVLATQDNPHFHVSRLEVDRPGPSYAVDTVRTLRDLYTKETDLYFITGADAILQILSWKDVGDMISMCKLVAATRPGYSLDGLEEIILKVRKEHKEDFNVFCIEVPALMISSTDIRNRVRNGLPIKYLLPDEVERYIIEGGLYKQARYRAKQV